MKHGGLLGVLLAIAVAGFLLGRCGPGEDTRAAEMRQELRTLKEDSIPKLERARLDAEAARDSAQARFERVDTARVRRIEDQLAAAQRAGREFDRLADELRRTFGEQLNPAFVGMVDSLQLAHVTQVDSLEAALDVKEERITDLSGLLFREREVSGRLTTENGALRAQIAVHEVLQARYERQLARRAGIGLGFVRIPHEIAYPVVAVLGAVGGAAIAR